MRRELWPKASAKEGALDQMSKNYQVYFIRIIFLRNQKKKFTIEPKSNTARLLYLFFDYLLSPCLKKMKAEKSPRATYFCRKFEGDFVPELGAENDSSN